MKIPLLWLAALNSLLVACTTVGPDYHAPPIATPRQWSQPSVALARLESWWRNFNNPLLNDLIPQAIAANLELKQALLRVKDARILRSQTIAAGLPALNAKSSLSKRLNSSSQTNGSSQGNTGSGGFVVGNQLINVFQLGFDAQWELDFFGATRRAVQAAEANIGIEEENSRDVLVSLLAELARNVLALQHNQRLLALTQDSLTRHRASVQLLELQEKSGLTNALAVAQAQALMASTKAQLPVYQTQIELAVHAIGVLLGKDPNALMHQLTNAPPPNAEPARLLLTDLPADLLKRRPDVRKAEQQLVLATANVGIASADLYPKINLAAFLGVQNMRISDFTPVGKSWSSSASVTMPLFNWGKLNALLSSKKVQTEQAVSNYQQSILLAFQEVEDALSTYRQQAYRATALQTQLQASQLSLQLSTARYQAGLSDFLTVLDARQAVYNAERDCLSHTNEQDNTLLALYKALGGGWQTVSAVNGQAQSLNKPLATQLFERVWQ